MTTDRTIKPAKPQAREFTLSPDPNRAMREMLETLDTLRVLYLEEITTLDKADTKGFMTLQDRKIRVARDYQAGASQIFERKDEMKKKLDPRLFQILQRKQAEFAAITKENLKSIDRMRRSTQRLSDRIMHAARESVRKDTHCYSARGHLTLNERRVSLNLNESA